MADNSFDIKGGSNQILPNATESKQNIFIGDSAIKRSGRIARREQDENSNIASFGFAYWKR